MFNLQNQKKITNLNVNAHIYNHEKFGCQHLHLESENNEKVLINNQFNSMNSKNHHS